MRFCILRGRTKRHGKRCGDIGNNPGVNWRENRKIHASRASRSVHNTTGRLFHVVSRRWTTIFTSRRAQDPRKRAAVPFVITPDGQTIAGYYTLSQYAVQSDVLPAEVAKRLPKYPEVPATLLGRLAVSMAFRGKGLGAMLLMDAHYRTLLHSRELACAGVIVDAKDVMALAFYKKYGFLELPRTERRLFLPIGTIQQLFR
jgi:ribosomal protein S18 acetylase RimI-like enzyme